MALQSRNRKMKRFFASTDYNPIFVVQNSQKSSCGWMVSALYYFLKVFKNFKSLRFVWWMEDEWMTRLSSYYEHLVQPGRSVLGKRNYFGPKFVNWLTRLCATRTISSGVIRTQCVLQIPKACKEMSLSVLVLTCSLRRPLYSVHFK